MPSSVRRKLARESHRESNRGSIRCNCPLSVEERTLSGNLRTFPFAHYLWKPFGLSRCYQLDSLYGKWAPRCQVTSDLFEGPLGMIFWFADKRAEKSRLPRRRKRDLRKGARRSRGCQPRASVPSRQPLTKPQSSRRVNHVGRKFLWAVKASNRFRVIVRKYVRMPSKPFYHGRLMRVTSAKALLRHSLERSWKSLHDRAVDLGIPDPAAFHSSFERYISIEATDGPGFGFECLLAGLPRKEDIENGHSLSGVGNRPDIGQHSVDGVGNSNRTEPVPFCKACKGLGATPGLGYPRGCSKCCRTHPEFGKIRSRTKPVKKRV